MERFTNNFEKYSEEVLQKLHSVPDLTNHSILVSFSEVHSLWLCVYCIFVFRNNSSGELLILKRTWNMADHKSTYGIYFPDQIKFSNVMMEADKETSEALLGFLNKELAAPNEHNYIILDGSEYRINVYGDNSKEFTWKHNDELNDKTRNFVKFLGKIVG